MDASLLHYRPWRGTFRGPWSSVWPIARVALGMMFRRKLFWVLYGFGLLIFLMFFFGQYLLAWAETQSAGQSVPVFLGVKMRTERPDRAHCATASSSTAPTRPTAISSATRAPWSW